MDRLLYWMTRLPLLFLGFLLGITLAGAAYEIQEALIGALLMSLLAGILIGSAITVFYRTTRNELAESDVATISEALSGRLGIDQSQVRSFITQVAKSGSIIWLAMTSLSLMLASIAALFSAGQLAVMHRQNEILVAERVPILTVRRVAYLNKVGLVIENNGRGPASLRNWRICRDGKCQPANQMLCSNAAQESSVKASIKSGAIYWATYRTLPKSIAPQSSITLCMLEIEPSLLSNENQKISILALHSFTTALRSSCVVFDYRSTIDKGAWKKWGNAKCAQRTGVEMNRGQQ